MPSIFAVSCSSDYNALTGAKFFTTLERARTHLKKLADERRYNMGVSCFTEDENKFSYLFGWEEHKIVFQIIELKLDLE